MWRYEPCESKVVHPDDAWRALRDRRAGTRGLAVAAWMVVLMRRDAASHITKETHGNSVQWGPAGSLAEVRHGPTHETSVNAKAVSRLVADKQAVSRGAANVKALAPLQGPLGWIIRVW